MIITQHCMIETSNFLKVKMKLRKAIPKALRQQVWINEYGCDLFKNKCYVSWCNNIITPFNFEVGHNIPYSRGGTDKIDNLKPICSLCNKSMSNKYTIDEFIDLGGKVKKHELIKKENKLLSSFNLPCCFNPIVNE